MKGISHFVEKIISSVLSALKCIFHGHDHKRKRSRSLFGSLLLPSFRTTEKSKMSSKSLMSQWKLSTISFIYTTKTMGLKHLHVESREKNQWYSHWEKVTKFPYQDQHEPDDLNAALNTEKPVTIRKHQIHKCAFLAYLQYLGPPIRLLEHLLNSFIP